MNDKEIILNAILNELREITCEIPCGKSASVQQQNAYDRSMKLEEFIQILIKGATNERR